MAKGTDQPGDQADYGMVGITHIAILTENLERSVEFYHGVLGLKFSEERPHHVHAYRGAWFWVGETTQSIHILELPNPDPLTGRPEHGGRDRHVCIHIRDVLKLKTILDKAGTPYTMSPSGRSIYTRDPDANGIEFMLIPGN